MEGLGVDLLVNTASTWGYYYWWQTLVRWTGSRFP